MPRYDEGVISWADVAAAHEDYEKEHHCRVEYGLVCYRKFKHAQRPSWQVVAHATTHAGRANEVRGASTVDLGGTRGARTMAGAVLRAMMQAVSDLEHRRADKLYDRDNAPERLPGM